jgi:hypothetical protein
MSDEMIDSLMNNVRLPSGFMAPKIAILPEAKDMLEDPIFKGKVREGQIGYLVKVLKNAVFHAVGEVKDAIPLSKQVAKAKKRSRVFALEDNDQTKPGKNDTQF